MITSTVIEAMIDAENKLMIQFECYDAVKLVPLLVDKEAELRFTLGGCGPDKDKVIELRMPMETNSGIIWLDVGEEIQPGLYRYFLEVVGKNGGIPQGLGFIRLTKSDTSSARH